MDPTPPVPTGDHPAPMSIGKTRFVWGSRTFVMGVINATPDSFSGDGIADPSGAANLARAMVEAGADLIDIGAESTRPEFAPVDADDESITHLAICPDHEHTRNDEQQCEQQIDTE